MAFIPSSEHASLNQPKAIRDWLSDEQAYSDFSSDTCAVTVKFVPDGCGNFGLYARFFAEPDTTYTVCEGSLFAVADTYRDLARRSDSEAVSLIRELTGYRGA